MKVSVRSKNPVIIYEDYAEIILLDRDDNERARTKISIEKLPLARMYRWHLSNNGYVMSSSNKKLPRISLHRLITNAPEGMLVDHRDLDKLNNLDNNLRVCTDSNNKMNTKLSSRNKSGVKGVFYVEKEKKWKAMIYVHKKPIYLGLFKDFEEACVTRHKAEEKYFKEFRFQS